jgi:hypothetical protein
MATVRTGYPFYNQGGVVKRDAVFGLLRTCAEAENVVPELEGVGFE